MEATDIRNPALSNLKRTKGVYYPALVAAGALFFLWIGSLFPMAFGKNNPQDRKRSVPIAKKEQTVLTILNEPTLYAPQCIYKTDTIEYITNNYPIQNEARIIHIINRLPGFELDSSRLYFQAKLIKKIKINGKENAGKDMLEVTRKLPADILEEVQVIDDYGDVASITSIKTGEPEKIINLIVRDIKNRRLPWAIDRRGVTIPGDTVAKPKPLMGWKRYADYIRQNGVTSAKFTDEILVFFYVAPDGTISNIQAVGYSSGIQYAKAISIIKNGPGWLGYSEPRQVWLKMRLPKK